MERVIRLGHTLYGENMMASKSRLNFRVKSGFLQMQFKSKGLLLSAVKNCDRMPPLGEMHCMIQHILGQIQW